MIDINAWMHIFQEALKETFPDRIWFIGLQGSYARQEASDTSDIDVVVILDNLAPRDLAAYNRMLDTLPHRELICGFLSGKDEILNWEPSDLFQFYHDTIPIKGSLDCLLPVIDNTAVMRAIKIGVCNIYHGCVHNMLHDKNEEILMGLYKSASFVLQAICFQKTGNYIRLQLKMLPLLDPDDRVILETFMQLKNGGKIEFQNMSEKLFIWCGKWIKTA